MVRSTTTPITGNQLGAFPDGIDSPGVVSLTLSTTLTKAEHGSGRILKLDGTGAALTQTLPAATGSGDKYTFVVGAVKTSSHIISAGAGVFQGNVITNSTGDTPDLAQPWPAGGGDTITLNGTTKGGQAIGDIVEVIDIAEGVWQVSGVTTTSGTEATPFS